MTGVSETHLNWQGPIIEKNWRHCQGERATDPSLCQGRVTVKNSCLGSSKPTAEPNQWSAAELGGAAHQNAQASSPIIQPPPNECVASS